ncbi:hypothetical protein C8035_v010803 [Colletotrichum spinosum]|uniref:Carboxylesterase type B domain-containing protein n=1 Tax=Colletotrichum spinosum TaxID=1347390 RepID=A0A4V3HS72_9PEZI|nr:hypothetical protein C8035_v010803 [Colletotrichum spinosum]
MPLVSTPKSRILVFSTSDSQLNGFATTSPGLAATLRESSSGAKVPGLLRGSHRHRLHQELWIALHPDRKLRSSDTAHSSFTSLGSAFGCEKTEELECLRRVPFRDGQKYLNQAGNLTFNVVVDERTKFSDYAERTLDGKVAKGPAIIGSTRDEWNFNTNVPIRPSNSSDVPADSVFGCPAHYETALRNVAGLKTWRYMYSGNFTNIMPGGHGAHHSAELPLIFGTHDIARGNSTVFEDRVSDVMQDLWRAFVESPEDGPAKRGWAATPLGGLDETQTGVDLGFRGTVLRKFSWSAWEAACTNETTA